MTSQMIRRFMIDAVYEESALIAVKETMTKTIVGMMKDEGFVPLYDVNPVWTSMMLKNGNFAGQLVMQGVYVGEDKAWQIDGMVDGKLIPSTPKSK